MPATPFQWTNIDFLVNSNINGVQSVPRMTQLSNGNVLFSWNNFDNTPGTVGSSTAGCDIVGRIFDSQGNPVTAEFQLNIQFSLDDEQFAEVTALENGGFMVVYEDNGPENNLGYDTFDAAGVHLEGGAVLVDAPGGAVPNSPAVASASTTSVMTAYVIDNADGSESVFVRAYNPLTDAFVAAVEVLVGATGVAEGIGGIGLTTLSNGQFALAIANRNAAADTILLRTLTAAGVVDDLATISPGVEVGTVKCAG